MATVQRLYDICKASFTSSGPRSLEVLHNVRDVLGDFGIFIVNLCKGFKAGWKEKTQLYQHLKNQIYCKDILATSSFHLATKRDTINPSDVGLEEVALVARGSSGSAYRVNGRKGRNGGLRYMPPITYLHIHECESFSIGIFCMPASSIIHLHDHPGMTVLSKLLYGSVHAKAYDWVDPSEVADSSKAKLAKLVKDCEMSAPCDTTILFPTYGGNIHSFRALSPCALLDVLVPPYSTDEGRNCTYYRKSLRKVHPALQVNGINVPSHQLAWLEEYQPPDDFVVRRGVYKGPEVVL